MLLLRPLYVGIQSPDLHFLEFLIQLLALRFVYVRVKNILIND